MRNVFWPKVDTIEDAKAASRAGAWAAIFVAAMTGVVAILAFAGIQIFGQVKIEVWSLIDSALFILIAWGLFRYSRVAAVVGLLLYLVERIVMMASGLTGGLIVSVIIILMFIGAVRGTIAYRRLTKAQ
ncbi:MAG: hypothetical protein ACREOO_14720 [bacterium]